MEKLYELTKTRDIAKQDLYIRKQGDTLDFITYFNSFSLAKWKQYTTLQEVALHLRLTGSWQVVWKTVDATGEKVITKDVCNQDVYEHSFPASLAGTLLGFELMPLTKDSHFQGGAWYGSFAKWQEKKIGISICTFKREQYVKRTMSVLREFQQTHSWISVLVVDNGNTLPKEDQERFRIIYNPNYGGSGGFTRGMIEYVDAEKVDYVLLMDDDIILDPTALERSYSLLCGLRDEYLDSFLAGAMLRIETPTIQHENTAYWDKIVSKVLFQGLDLTNKENLAKNGVLSYHANAYGGWWYCCVPVKRIRKIGCPLPAFIKSDDMEYGIRNGKELICLNGIGVWHESFEKKLSSVMRFFSDRNTFILNHYAHSCNRWTLLSSILARIAKRILRGEFSKLIVLQKALEEYQKGFAELTKLPGDVYFAKMNSFLQHASLRNSIFKLPKNIFSALYHYNQIQEYYTDFRENELGDSVFWKKYLHMKEG